jgi:3-oxoacyl-[acyl-carrier-protein] synthase-3
MNAYIAGLGTYVPEKILTNFDLEKIVETSDEWIRTRSGVKERRISAQDEPTIEAIIVATATPDMFFPSTACLVQSKIGARKIISFDIGAGCSGWLYGLSIVDSFIKTGYNNILVIGAEELSKVTD